MTTELDASPPSPRRRAPPLSTVGQAVAYTAGILAEVRAGRMETDMARTLLYGIQVLAQLLQGAELERRIDELERAASARRFTA